MEEMLCSLASPCFLMWVSKGGQYKTRGNVITFSQDITQLCVALPRLPEQLDVLVVRKPAARDPSTYKDFRVRKHKVLAFLRFLKDHNPFYSNVSIRPAQDVDLPLDGDVLHRLPHVTTATGTSDTSVPSPAPSCAVLDDTVSSSYVPDTLAEEHNVFVPGAFLGTSELDSIRSGIRELGLDASDGHPLPWPSSGPAFSEYTTDGLFTMAFPSLFPFGLADYSTPRCSKLELYEWVKHLMRYRDSRFATHPRFRFFALNLIFRHRAMSRGKFLFTRDVGHRNMTVGQLRNTLAGNNGAQLASKIIRCVQSIRGTRPYWSMEGAKLRDMIFQIGTPTFFYTLSMADMSWPDLHCLMPDDPFRPGLTAGESYQIRCRNVANNPHIVAAYLTTRHRHLRETILQHLGIADDCPVDDFWYRIEWQSRGSGVFKPFAIFSVFLYLSEGHIHGFLWLRNAVRVDNVDWNVAEQVETIRDYFSQFLTAFNADPNRPRPETDCLLKDYVLPDNRRNWDLGEDHINLCNRCQTHGALLRGECRCIPAQCYKRGSCRFHFPYPVTPCPRAFVDSSGRVPRKCFAAHRNDPWLNQHSKLVLLGWRANVDMQPVLDREAAITYIAKYASKPETLSESYHAALNGFCSRLPAGLPAESAVQRLFARMAADRDISAQEAVHLLLGDHLVGCSRSFVNLNSQVDAPHALRNAVGLDDDDTAFQESFFSQYQARPDHLGHLNAIQLCSAYSVSQRLFLFRFFFF